jgi:hypothetical protein
VELGPDSEAAGETLRKLECPGVDAPDPVDAVGDCLSRCFPCFFVMPVGCVFGPTIFVFDPPRCLAEDLFLNVNLFMVMAGVK